MAKVEAGRSIRLLQESRHSGLVQNGGCRSNENGMNSEYVLKLELRAFAG